MFLISIFYAQETDDLDKALEKAIARSEVIIIFLYHIFLVFPIDESINVYSDV